MTAATFLQDLDELLDDERYLWAAETLRGIRSIIEQSNTVTAGQERAVANIRSARGRRLDVHGELPSQRFGSSRRYEGFER